jgi:hypothetical protein
VTLKTKEEPGFTAAFPSYMHLFPSYTHRFHEWADSSEIRARGFRKGRGTVPRVPLTNTKSLVGKTQLDQSRHKSRQRSSNNIHKVITCSIDFWITYDSVPRVTLTNPHDLRLPVCHSQRCLGVGVEGKPLFSASYRSVLHHTRQGCHRRQLRLPVASDSFVGCV